MGDNDNTAHSGSRGRRGFATAIALAILAGTLAGLVPARAADAAVSGITNVGSIVYVKDNDIWLTSPDGVTQKRLTTDGNTDTSDLTGSNGYDSPSQSDNGDVIVAFRNEGRTDDPLRADGYFWVMNRQGEVIRKFQARQGIRFGSTMCAGLVVAPRGIVDAAVSPDGTKIAYVTQSNYHHPDCPRVVEHTHLWVVNIDGTNTVQITADGFVDLDGPSWLTNSRLLMNRLSTNRTYFADLPGTVATDWTWGGEEPDQRAGKLASHGVDTDWAQALFLLTSSGPPAQPEFRCAYTGPAGGDDARFASPTWAQDASALAWEEGDGVADETNEGIWVMAVGNLATGCPSSATKQLLAPGGRQPDWGPASAGPQAFAINDVSVLEGNSGTRPVTFTVTRTSAAGTATVSWFTANGTATAPGDYTGVGVTPLTFAPGETAKQVSVQVTGDMTFEPAETFFVKLTSPGAGSTITDGTGRATIINDDGSLFSINDVSLAEGNSGTRSATFTVSRSSGTGTAAVSWYTANGTATAPSDYVAVGATRLHYAAGETSKQVSVTVNGDTAIEGAETFFVKLTAPSAGASIADGTGRATITNDDVSAFSVNDVSVVEGSDWMSRTATFTVTRSSGVGAASVSWATVDGTAIAWDDYEPVSVSPISFADGETAKEVSVTIYADTGVEANETFFVKLGGQSAGTIVSDSTGRGTIVNDDTA